MGQATVNEGNLSEIRDSYKSISASTEASHVSVVACSLPALPKLLRR